MAVSKKMSELIGALAGQRQMLLDAIAGLNETQLNYKPGEDIWSISDILQHLAMTDEANVKFSTRLVQQGEAGELPPDPAPDGSVLNALDGFVSQMNTPFKAPDRVVPKAPAPTEESLARLDAARQQLIENIEKLSPYDLSHLTYPHPVLGPLNAYQWLVLTGGHEMRHAKQVEGLKAREGFPQG